MKIDFKGHRVIVQDKTIWLTKKENSLLELLYSQKGNTVTYEEITETIYQSEPDDFLLTVIRKHISFLREKIEKYITIRNIKGVGYIIENEAISEYAEVMEVKLKQEQNAQDDFSFDSTNMELPF